MKCYVGKIDRTLHRGTKEHAYAKSSKNKQSRVYEHFSLSTHCRHIADLFKIDTSSTYRKSQIIPLFLTGETIGTFYFLKKH